MSRFHLGATVLLALAMLTGAPRTVQAAESYDNCTGYINSIPAVISSQGTWCLKQNLSTTMNSGNAITVQANNVTIDCNDFDLSGKASLPQSIWTDALGIVAQDRLNVTVRHCNIRGFRNGLMFTGSTGGGHLVEDNRFEGNMNYGISVEGDGSVVRRNLVSDTGGWSEFNVYYTTGIDTRGTVDVLDNTVSKVTSVSYGDPIGIQTVFNSGGSIGGNHVLGLVPKGTGLPKAIINILSDHLTMRNNDLIGKFIVGSIGIDCESTTGFAKNNEINGFATSMNSCSDAGGNFSAP